MTSAIYYKGKEQLIPGQTENRAPGPGEVQIRVSWCGICGTDLHIFHGRMDGRVGASRIIGHEASGIVEAIGTGVKDLQVGQAVTVMPLDWCGECPSCKAGHTHICQKLRFLGIDSPGAFQSLWTVPSRAVFPLPASVKLDRAALIEPLAVACHDIRRGRVTAGELVVVLGGGPIGALIALVARGRGARVIVSELNGARISLLQSLGLECVNPKERDLVELVNERSGGAGADVVFEVTGHPDGVAMATKLPRTRGRIVVVGIFAKAPPVDLFAMFWRELELVGARVYELEDFIAAIGLAADEELGLDHLISARLPLVELEKGIRQMESGGDCMKILIRCNSENNNQGKD
ncbi:MAG: alcohol dehydrogenase catalytic domain-containing protein [Planctomycetes bacterium]|nr:alcohol dehydrogenase catalytic domain-containing protein [Planctomycetota bacterium]